MRTSGIGHHNPLHSPVSVKAEKATAKAPSLEINPLDHISWLDGALYANLQPLAATFGFGNKLRYFIQYIANQCLGIEISPELKASKIASTFITGFKPHKRQTQWVLPKEVAKDKACLLALAIIRMEGAATPTAALSRLLVRGLSEESVNIIKTLLAAGADPLYGTPSPLDTLLTLRRRLGDNETQMAIIDRILNLFLSEDLNHPEDRNIQAIALGMDLGGYMVNQIQMAFTTRSLR